MNIYLDIDGVLLANTVTTANFADDFLQYVLGRWPDSTYWLTTHQWRGQDRTLQLLKPVLNARTRKLMPLIKPTNWRQLKTDGIDFSKEFLWFDDDLYPEEREVLSIYNVLGSWIEVNLQKDPNQLLDEIAHLRALP